MKCSLEIERYLLYTLDAEGCLHDIILYRPKKVRELDSI